MTRKKVTLAWDGTRFICPNSSCGYRSNDRRNMKRHIEAKHVATFAFVCDLCLAGFNRKRDVDQHEIRCKGSIELNSKRPCKRLKYITEAAFNERLPGDVEEELQAAQELLEEKDLRIENMEQENASIKTSLGRLLNIVGNTLSRSQLNLLQAADGYEGARGTRDGQHDHLRVDDNTSDATVHTKTDKRVMEIDSDDEFELQLHWSPISSPVTVPTSPPVVTSPLEVSTESSQDIVTLTSTSVETIPVKERSPPPPTLPKPRWYVESLQTSVITSPPASPPVIRSSTLLSPRTLAPPPSTLIQPQVTTEPSPKRFTELTTFLGSPLLDSPSSALKTVDLQSERLLTGTTIAVIEHVKSRSQVRQGKGKDASLASLNEGWEQDYNQVDRIENSKSASPIEGLLDVTDPTELTSKVASVMESNVEVPSTSVYESSMASLITLTAPNISNEMVAFPTTTASASPMSVAQREPEAVLASLAVKSGQVINWQGRLVREGERGRVRVENTEVVGRLPLHRKSGRVPAKEKYKREVEKVLSTSDPCELGLVVRDTSTMGRGIFTSRKFDQGEPVCEYKGEVISGQEAKNRVEIRGESSYEFYFKEDSKLFCVDASQNTSHPGRLVNHSKKCFNLIPKVSLQMEKTIVYINFPP